MKTQHTWCPREAHLHSCLCTEGVITVFQAVKRSSLPVIPLTPAADWGGTKKVKSEEVKPISHPANGFEPYCELGSVQGMGTEMNKT